MYICVKYSTTQAPENVTNTTLASTKCVAWNFTLEDGVGGWSSEGCNYTGMENGRVSCECNHATNFAVLMVGSYYHYIFLVMIQGCLRSELNHCSLQASK